jgi:plasmid replication initiation protein
VSDDALHDAARWCARLAEVLGDVGRRAVELGQVVARDWPDARGHEWAERTSALGALLGREATASAELGESYARAGRGTGMRLGGTDAERVDDERGMRIAELDPPPPGR